ncbi:hypothetical protein NGM44_00465 [Moraxella sp. FZFQ2102]|uniref:energy transducer TonB n=1 Tax=Moraxella sp. FZFQ2102 TaxID=2953752 RepID=UPI00209BC12E|nr:hypothetical protein [Moraxella sp. FZFQ2102]USZ14910.1 hypothetical protein NGM44_00465 [Moraxella sp. FZFQ2102]
MLDSTNKTKAVALAVALVLHGVAGLGIATMQMKILTPPKITPPLEVEFIKPEPKPEPEKIILNNLESPKPVKVEPKPAMKNTQAVVPPKGDTQVSEVKDSPSSDDTPPATEDVATPPQTIETDPVQTTPITPSSESTPDVVPDTPTVEPVTPVVTTTITPVTSSDDHTVTPATNPADAQDNNIAPVTTLTTMDNTPTSTPPASATPANVSPTNVVNNATTNNQGGGKDDKTQNDKGGKDDKDNQGGVIGGQDLGTISNASWARKPNFANLNSNEITGNVSTTATLTIDDKGRITAVSGVSTGNKQLDRDIVREIKRARLKPFKKGNNTLSGTATLPININLS